MAGLIYFLLSLARVFLCVCFFFIYKSVDFPVGVVCVVWCGGGNEVGTVTEGTARTGSDVTVYADIKQQEIN